MRFHNLVERQILKAKAEGKLHGLAGEGRPLPDRPPEDATAVGMRIIAEAGVLPKEFELKKQVDAQLEVLRETTCPEERKNEMSKLADLQLKLSIEQEARRKFYNSG